MLPPILESARIARGAPKPLSELKAEDVDALVVPGGFGAAKNLCDFGFKVKLTPPLSESFQGLKDLFPGS